MLKLQYFGHLMRRANSLEKILMLGKSEEEKGTIENEMVEWHYQFNGHRFKQTLGDSKEQGSLACCRPWGLEESDTTERLSNNNTFQGSIFYISFVRDFIKS